MSLITRNVSIGNAFSDPVQFGLLEELLKGQPEVDFYTPSVPYVQFPDPNEVAAPVSRESHSITFKWPLAADQGAGQAGLYVKIKDQIAETSARGSLENALAKQGTVSATLFKYVSGVEIGRWQLTDALIISAGIDEILDADNKPAFISLSVEFNGILK